MPADAGEAQAWFRYARRDLIAAGILVESEEVDTVVAIAQLQQAVEKALKGLHSPGAGSLCGPTTSASSMPRRSITTRT